MSDEEYLGWLHGEQLPTIVMPYEYYDEMSVQDLREPTLLLLTALTSGPRHGYALIEGVAALSAGRVQLKPGSLYGTLDRLSREGLVTETGTEVVAGRLRRYYALSDAGEEVLSAQVARLESITAAASAGLRRRSSERRSGPGSFELAGGAA